MELRLGKDDVPKDLLAKLRTRFTERLMISSPSIAERSNTSFTELAKGIENNKPFQARMVLEVDESGWVAPYQLDPTKTPQEIDVILKHDRNVAERVKGIYEANADSAVLSLGENERPRTFGPPTESRGYRMKLRRIGQ